MSQLITITLDMDTYNEMVRLFEQRDKQRERMRERYRASVNKTSKSPTVFQIQNVTPMTTYGTPDLSQLYYTK